MGDARLARESVEVLVKSVGAARLARESTEVLIKSVGAARLARESVEVLINPTLIPATKTVSFRNESGAWVSTADKEIKLYDGSTWQSVSHPTVTDIKVWDGSAWVSIKP
jgi:hypothetical protein